MQNVFAMGLIMRDWAVLAHFAEVVRDRSLLGSLDFGLSGTTSPRRWPSDRHDLLRLPDDVRRHHAGDDHRRHGRPSEVQQMRCSTVLVAGRSWPSPLGGTAAAGSSTWARSTSPAAPAITSTPASPRRRGRRDRAAAHDGSKPMPPHNLPLTVLGTGHPLVRLVQFNAGSALRRRRRRQSGAGEHAPRAAAAMLGWLIVERIKTGTRPRSGRAPAPSPVPSRLTVRRLRRRHVADHHRPDRRHRCYLALFVKGAQRLDDSLDVIAVHLVGGLVGTRRSASPTRRSIPWRSSRRGIFYRGSGEAAQGSGGRRASV